MKDRKPVYRKISLEADADGQVIVPEKIHLLSVGHWHTPYHGAFEHTPEDLAQMIVNWEEAVGVRRNDKTGKVRAPINYGHDRGGKAAGWITRIFLDNGGKELWGDTTWTPEGRRSIADGEYDGISPEWNPREFPWENPEVEGEFVENVFLGAALTNIPLFSKLKSLMASQDAGGDSDKSNEHQGGDMKLEDILAKKTDERTDEEKAFVVEHKAELTADQLKAEGLDVEDAGGSDEDKSGQGDDANKGGTPVEASQKGTVSIDAAKLASLEAAAKAGLEASQKLLRNELTASVKEHVERGAIKSDQLDSTVDMLMASSAEVRKSQLDFMTNLPSNTLVASEHGKAEGGDATASATLFEKAKAIMASQNVNIDAAMKEARKANPELAKQFDQEQKESK